MSTASRCTSTSTTVQPSRPPRRGSTPASSSSTSTTARPNRDAREDEIVAVTREVVEYAARTTGALVESEPHYFAGSSDVHDTAIDYDEIRKTFSTPEGARAFVAATGIDTFAAAVGRIKTFGARGKARP